MHTSVANCSSLRNCGGSDSINETVMLDITAKTLTDDVVTKV